NPQLMPGLPQIRRINHALAIRRKIRASLPVSFFVMNLFIVGIGVMSIARLGARLCRDPPESARAVNMPPIRNKQNFRSIPRPYRTDLVIHLTVVITRQRADILWSKLPHVAE